MQTLCVLWARMLFEIHSYKGKDGKDRQVVEMGMIKVKEGFNIHGGKTHGQSKWGIYVHHCIETSS